MIPQLRVALVWHDEVMGDVVLDGPGTVTVGTAANATFVIPDIGLPANFAFIKPGPRGYLLTLAATMAGTVCLDGTERDVSEFMARGGEGDVGGGTRTAPIATRDWGVVELDDSGNYKLFFQFVARETPLIRSAPSLPVVAVSVVAGAAALSALAYFLSDLSVASSILVGGISAIGLTALLLGAIFLIGAAINAEAEQHASFAFAIFLCLAFLLASFKLFDYENPFVWPGKRELTGNYLVTRLDPPEPEPEIQVTAVGTASADSAPAAEVPVKVNSATKGAEGAAGGEGNEPRARDPNAKDVPPEPPKVALFTDENRKRLDNIIGIDLATDLGKFTGIDGPLTKGGIGSGPGKGTGFGPGTGTGTTKGGKGKGPGGGGSAEGDFQSSGKIDTGETRAPKGTGGTGSGIKEAKVGFAGGGTGKLDGLSMSEIDKVVRARQGVFKSCYQRELNRSPGIGGKLVVNFVIAADGSVKSSRIDSGKSSLRNAAVESCVKGNIARLRFPAKGGGIVNYPFVFSQGG